MAEASTGRLSGLRIWDDQPLGDERVCDLLVENTCVQARCRCHSAMAGTARILRGGRARGDDR